MSPILNARLNPLLLQNTLFRNSDRFEWRLVINFTTSLLLLHLLDRFEHFGPSSRYLGLFHLCLEVGFGINFRGQIEVLWAPSLARLSKSIVVPGLVLSWRLLVVEVLVRALFNHYFDFVVRLLLIFFSKPLSMFFSDPLLSFPREKLEDLALVKTVVNHVASFKHFVHFETISHSLRIGLGTTHSHLLDSVLKRWLVVLSSLHLTPCERVQCLHSVVRARRSPVILKHLVVNAPLTLGLAHLGSRRRLHRHMLDQVDSLGFNWHALFRT